MERRPILGFGPAGWVSLAVLLGLSAAWWRGVDLRDELMRLVHETLGIEAVYGFCFQFLYPQFTALWSPVFGLVSLVYVLPAMHLSPGRRPGWMWMIVTAWASTSPALWLILAKAGRPLLPPGVSWDSLWLSALVMNAAALMALRFVVKSNALVVVGIAVTAPALVVAGMTSGSTQPLVLTVAGWHAVIGATLVLAAVRARRAQFPVGACPRCGYDLAGLGERVCPECGSAAARGVRPAQSLHAGVAD